MMQVVIAPNAFKNSLDAASVAEAISTGLHQSRLECSTVNFPIGDGGDGTGALLIQHLKGTKINVGAHDALGRKIQSSFGLIDNGNTAVIELADASGLRLLQPQECDPLNATTYGTGELINAALDKDVRKIIMCIGGSATVDGATGILQALGVTFLDSHRNKLQALPQSLLHLAEIDTSALEEKIKSTEIIVLCDVENTLLGEHGAAAVFGPQKGASPADVDLLEACLAQLSKIVFAKTGKDISAVKHGGAAGGVAAGLYGLLSAKPVHGIDYFLNSTGFENIIQHADLVITGEGSLDAQTLQGKGPFGVAQKAKEHNIPVIGIAGRVPLETSVQMHHFFDVLLPISHEAMDMQAAMQYTYKNLVRSGELLGNILCLQHAR